MDLSKRCLTAVAVVAVAVYHAEAQVVDSALNDSLINAFGDGSLPALTWSAEDVPSIAFPQVSWDGSGTYPNCKLGSVRNNPDGELMSTIVKKCSSCIYGGTACPNDCCFGQSSPYQLILCAGDLPYVFICFAHTSRKPVFHQF